MELVTDELHFFEVGTNEYQLSKTGFCEYQLFYIRGFKTLDSGSAHYMFIPNVDYQLRGDKIYWLGNDLPAIPPSVLGYDHIPFWVTYVYEKRPESTIKSSMYPFIAQDSRLTAVMNAFGTQIFNMYQKKGNLVRKRSLNSSTGNELDFLGSWYNTSRYDGESDASFRARLQEFLSTFLSSGTSESIIAIMQKITGVTPTIEEFWQQISYYDYNPNDASQIYVYDDGSSDNVAKYYSFINQPSSFHVIFDESDYSVFPTFGPYNLKKTLNIAKAEGVVGYIGYLVDESFGLNDNNWDVQTHIPSDPTATDTGNHGTWTVTGGEYEYTDTSSAYHDGLSVIDNSDFDDAWGDYQITGYARDATGGADQVSGLVTRWQATGSDQYEFYLFGISAADDYAYAYHWNGSSWGSALASADMTSYGGINTSTDYHLRIDMRGQSARFYVDNELVISDVDAWDALQYGRPGVACVDTGTHAAQTAYFDEIQVVV